MTKAIELKATIEKIVRTNGKAEAQMIVTVPLALSVEIPLGAVKINVQTLQSALFGANSESTESGTAIAKPKNKKKK